MSAIKFRTLEGGTTTVDGAALKAIGAALRGKVLADGVPGYDEARTIWNAVIDRKPGVIIRCQGAADVVQAIQFAAAHKLLVAVRGGGHNIAGNAVCDGGLPWIKASSVGQGIFLTRPRHMPQEPPTSTSCQPTRLTVSRGLTARTIVVLQRQSGATIHPIFSA